MTLTLDKAVSSGNKVLITQVHEFEDVLGNVTRGLTFEVTNN